MSSGIIALGVRAPLRFERYHIGEQISAGVYCITGVHNAGGYVHIGEVVKVHADGSADIALLPSILHCPGARGYMSAAAYRAHVATGCPFPVPQSQPCPPTQPSASATAGTAAQIALPFGAAVKIGAGGQVLGCTTGRYADAELAACNAAFHVTHSYDSNGSLLCSCCREPYPYAEPPSVGAFKCRSCKVEM